MTPGAIDALNSIDPGSLSRESWVRIAFAAKDAGIPEADFLEWCQRGTNYDEADAVTTYRNAKPSAGPGGITSATLFKAAIDAGYKPERKGGNGTNGGAHPTPRTSSPREPAAAPIPAIPPTDPAPIWAACKAIDVHPYLARKGIKPHGARVNAQGTLVVPYYDREGKLQTLQTISADGQKRFLAGAKQKGSCVVLGDPRGAPVLVVGEGFATVAAIHEATGFAALGAGSRVMFSEAARIARQFTPQGRVIIAADRGDLASPLAAARAVDAFLALPGPEDSHDGFDFNDWRVEGATDAEIRARLEHAPRVPPLSEPDPKPVDPVSKRPVVSVKNPVAPGSYILDDKGRIMQSHSNVFAYLVTGGAGELRRDTFTGVTTWRGMPVNDATYLAVVRAVQHAVIDGSMPFAKVPVSMVVDAVLDAAEQNSYNSCVEWLDSLPAWDGIARIANFFIDVCDLLDSEYLRGVGRYFWLGMVGRMATPGIQVDSAIALVGTQGIGKSSLARMVGGERYGEVGLANIGERDWVAQLRGKIIVEIAELSGHGRAELEAIKATLTRTHDEYRSAYARTAAVHPRGCVFLATTNERDFLIDAGGNRRWLPVQCGGPFHLDNLASMRAQYFAEAYSIVREGLAHDWFVIESALEVQADHLARDPWLDILDERLRDVATGELPADIANVAIYEVLKIPAERQSGGGTGRRIAAVMRTLGYDRAKWLPPNGTSTRQIRGFRRRQSDA